MKIAAMAAGAVGAYFGGRLQAGGHDVAYIARRAHLEALRRDGLKIESVHGDLHLPKVNATPDPKEVGPVNVVLFAVKLWDTETAAELAKPLVGPSTRLLSASGVEVIAAHGGVEGVAADGDRDRVGELVTRRRSAVGRAAVGGVGGVAGGLLRVAVTVT